MKKFLLATAMIVVATASPAVADETSDMLMAKITQLRERVSGLEDKVEHKSDLLACERAHRRALERALRAGEPVAVPRCAR